MDKITAASTHIRDVFRNKIRGMKKPDTQSVVLANLRMLRERRGDTIRDIAHRSGVPRSTVERIFSGKSEITINNAGALAAAYGLEGWHLLMKRLPEDLEQTKSIARLYKAYFASTREGREHITMVADREARYSGLKEPNGDEPTGTGA